MYFANSEKFFTINFHLENPITMKNLFKIKISIAILSISIVFYSCERILGGEDDRLVIQNNSSQRIYVYTQSNYPDTSISSYNPSLSKENYEVKAEEQKHIISHSWEQEVVRSASDTLMIFIFDADLVDTTSWETVIKEYKILRRYDFGLDNLREINWTVTYQ